MNAARSSESPAGPPVRRRRPRWRPTPGAVRVARWAVGWAAAPAVVGLYHALLGAVGSLPAERRVLSLEAGIFGFLCGLFAFGLWFVIGRRPTRAYILAHELTHALFGLLHGARIRSLRVREDRGSVTLSRTHAVTLLAPYCVPLYALGVAVVVVLLYRLGAPEALRVAAMGVLGMAWGLHLCYTLNSLLQYQSDLERCGYLFSYAVILYANLLFPALVLVATGSLRPGHFGTLWQTETARAYATLGRTLLYWHDRFWSWRSG